MFLFLLDNLKQRIGRIGVHQFERRNLLVKMAKDDTLDGDGCCCDCSATKKARNRTKREAADSAEVVAAAPLQSASFQHRTKPSAVAQLMVTEVVQLVHHVGRSPAGYPRLGGVDANRTMLASVVDFHHPVAECFTYF